MAEPIAGGAAQPCTGCGAPLRFSARDQSLACPHCGAVNAAVRPPAPAGPWDRGGTVAAPEEQDYARALRDLDAGAEVEETATLRCPGCGAEVSFDARTLADVCPFCATGLAKTDAHAHRHPKPGGVLPFALTEAEARGRMKAWLGRLWFAPSGLARYAEAGRPIAGVYLPHYTYDAEGSARYRGQRGDAYFVTRNVVIDGKSRVVQERRVRWTPASGAVAARFDDVLVAASDTAAEAGGGGAWDLDAMLPYDTQYLAGFRAEAPQLALDQGFVQAQAIMTGHLERLARADIGGDEQRIEALAPRFEAVSFKHVLLPVWLAAYRYRGRAYRVVINGRTGAVSGARPWSVWKIAVAVAIGLVLAAGAAWVIAQDPAIREALGIR